MNIAFALQQLQESMYDTNCVVGIFDNQVSIYFSGTLPPSIGIEKTIFLPLEQCNTIFQTSFTNLNEMALHIVTTLDNLNGATAALQE